MRQQKYEQALLAIRDQIKAFDERATDISARMKAEGATLLDRADAAFAFSIDAGEVVVAVAKIVDEALER